MTEEVEEASMGLIKFSKYIDEHQPNDEALTLVRMAKIAEQAGEALGDYIREQGRNILKEDLAVDPDEVAERVLSVAFTALATYEHMTGHDGDALPDLFDFIERMQQWTLVDKSVARPPSGV